MNALIKALDDADFTRFLSTAIVGLTPAGTLHLFAHDGNVIQTYKVPAGFQFDNFLRHTFPHMSFRFRWNDIEIDGKNYPKSLICTSSRGIEDDIVEGISKVVLTYDTDTNTHCEMTDGKEQSCKAKDSTVKGKSE